MLKVEQKRIGDWLLKSCNLAICLVLNAACIGGRGNSPTVMSNKIIDGQQVDSQLSTPTGINQQLALSGEEESPIELVVFGAGSLIIPFTELEMGFEAENPDIDVVCEFHGSIQVIRHATDLHESIDLVATADYTLIPLLMYSTSEPDSGLPYASWYIRFAGNRLALGYTPQSRNAAQLNSNNWYNILALPDTRLGIADPRFDPSGYRALMALKLGERFYHKRDIFDTLIANNFKYRITDFDEVNYSEIAVPEVVEPVAGSKIVIRGSSIQLVALLELGDLDYAFEYESVIQQHDLQMLVLPGAVNLGSDQYADNYRQVEVRIDFQRFAAVEPVFRGELIGYGLTIPVNAPHPEAAVRFIEFILSPRGRKIMQANFQPVLDVLECDGSNQMPLRLKTYCPVSVVQ